MPSKTIFVFLSLMGEIPSLMGRLYAESPRGRETCAFEFDPGWLRDNGGRGFLDPDLRMVPGRQYAPADKELFGLFSDSCPDRWGRQLMRRWEAISADRENRAPRQLAETDYLLGVCDEARMGALRFALRPEGPFLSAGGGDAVPPWAALREMEDASLAFERDGEAPNVLRVKKLLAPGAALGGARPKATVKDARGDLWIAKFPSVRDEHDAGAWEQAVHELAKACGLSVPESRLERFSNSGSTYVVKRFDRNGPGRRHFSSAMALLGQTDGADAEGGVGYPDIADLIVRDPRFLIEGIEHGRPASQSRFFMDSRGVAPVPDVRREPRSLRESAFAERVARRRPHRSRAGDRSRAALRNGKEAGPGHGAGGAADGQKPLAAGLGAVRDRPRGTEEDGTGF